MLEALAPETTQTATEKGFWSAGQDRDKAEMCMLMVSELGEAQEAHRHGRMEDHTTNRGFHVWVKEDDPDLWVAGYKAIIKGSVGEEMADFIIRLLDYMNGWEQTFYLAEFRKDSTKNFAHDLLKLVNWTLEAYHGQVEKNESKYWGAKSWGYLLTATIALCDWWNIDIISHIAWKMKYNKTREVLHGKKY